jgi:type II secretory pathway pseudopilin PulG
MRHQNILRRRVRDGGRGFTLVELVVVIGIIIALLSLVLAVSTLLIQQNEARQLQSAFVNLSSAVQEYEQAVGRPIASRAQRESVPGGSLTDPGNWDIPQNPDFVGLGYRNLENTTSNFFREGGTIAYFNQGINTTTTACDASGDPRGWEKQTVALFNLLQRTQSAEDIIARLDPSLLQRVKYDEATSLDSDGNPLPPLTKLVDPWGATVAVVFPGRAWRESDADGATFQIPDQDGTIRTAMENMIGVCRNGNILFVSAGPDGLIGQRYCESGSRREAALDNIYSYKPGDS